MANDPKWCAAREGIGLVYAALGGGMGFRSCGEVGASISNMGYGSAKTKLNVMKLSHGD